MRGTERPATAPLSLVRGLQERAARAVPAVDQTILDGCWLRSTDSATTWWAGASLLHGDRAEADLPRAVDEAERFYTDRGAPALFQVCPACPPGLDIELARRGYVRRGVMSLLVADSSKVAQTATALSLHVDVTETLNDRWFAHLLTAQGMDADAEAEWRLLRGVEHPSGYATAFVADRAVAVGRAVRERDWAGLFSMATVEEARRQGAGRAVLAALAAWAADQDAGRLYLQVTEASTAAVGLYRRAGFEQACTYHYRGSKCLGERGMSDL